MAQNRSSLGPRVLGRKGFDKVQAEVLGGRDKLGARVLGSRVGAKPPEPPTEPPELVIADLTLEELEKLLEKQPALLDRAVEAELARAKPRKGAVELLMDMTADDGVKADLARALDPDPADD